MTQAPRLPAPGPSFVREEVAVVGGSHDGDERRVRVGLSAPASTEDGWWLAVAWAADEDGVVEARDIAPRRGPPPGRPLDTLGPAFAGALSGLVAQENGRQALRVRMLAPAADEARPWERPLVFQLALKWDPIRSAVMRPNELAREVLRGLAAALENAGRPG